MRITHRRIAALFARVALSGAATSCMADPSASAEPSAPSAAVESSAVMELSPQAAAALTWTPVPGGHFCQSTGFDAKGQQGVVCANYYESRNGNSHLVIGELELKCGNSSGLLPCVSALAQGVYVADFYYIDHITARCVPSGPACPAAGFKSASVVALDVAVVGCANLYIIADARQGLGGFTLPDGTAKTTPSPFASSVRVCP
jgi:hypothetical protein